jgi:hypothetical protein
MVNEALRLWTRLRPLRVRTPVRETGTRSEAAPVETGED